MFRQLASWYVQANSQANIPPDQSLAEMQTLPTRQLEFFLDEAWLAGTYRANAGLGSPSIGLPPARTLEWPPAMLINRGVRQSGINSPNTPLSNYGGDIYPLAARIPSQWDHLIYAYMVENTRIFEITRRILWEFRHGERLQIPSSVQAQQWLDNTEYLLFKLGGGVGGASLIRPDTRMIRRNAYFRFFGMDLTHAPDGPSGGTFVKPDAANRSFSYVLEELMREVWRGIENTRNTSGANPTDDAALANLALELENMLVARRGTPSRSFLSREEFEAVAAMGWLHVSVMYDSPIVIHLNANAPSAAERLRILGEKVGLPAHVRSVDYIPLAETMSPVLTLLERGYYSTLAGVQLLYLPGPTRTLMENIISRWSMATGHDLKSRRVSLASRSVPSAQVRQTPPASRVRTAPPAPTLTQSPNGKTAEAHAAY